MQLLVMKNFKSYENQIVNNFSPHINVIIGRNGEGKSNFFKAINFVLTDRVSLNKAEYNTYSHKAIDSIPQSLTVQAYFRSYTGKQKESSLVKIERVWHPDITEQLKIEDKAYKRNEFECYVQSLGIAYSNSYHIIQQGKIQQLTHMDDFQLFRLLEEAVGLRKFQSKYEEAMSYLRNNNTQKEQINQKILQIDSRIRLYQNRRQEYQYHNYEQIAQKIRQKNELEDEVKKHTVRQKELLQKESNFSDQVINLKLKQKQMKSEFEKITQQISINKKQLYESSYNPQEDQIVKKSPFLSKEYEDLVLSLKKITEAKQKAKLQFQRKNKETQAAKKEMQAYKERYNSLNVQMQAEKLAKTSKGKIQAKQLVQRYQQNIRQTEQNIKKMNNYLKEFKIPTNIKDLEEIKSMKQKLGTTNIELKAAKIKIYEQSRIKNQIEYELEALNHQTEAYLNKMRKAIPLLQLSLLKELRKKKIAGVLGFLIEFVEIDPSVAFAYQMAGLSRLCTLLLQSEEACSGVIDTNRQAKCKQVNMLPLSVVRRQPLEKRNYPNIEDCYPLLNESWIKIKSHDRGQQLDSCIRKIINNSFGKYVLVKTYQLGLQISKKYHLNCITADREIIYSEGYFCKVGRDESVDDRLELYYKYLEKQEEILKASSKLTEASKELVALQNIELNLSKKKTIIEADITALNKKIDETSYQQRAMLKVQEQIDNLEKKRKAFGIQLQRVEAAQAAIETKTIIKVNKNEYAQLQQAYNSRLKAYNLCSQQEYTVQKNLHNLATQEEQVTDKIKIIKQQLEFNRSFNIQFVNGAQFRKNLEYSLSERENRLKQLQIKLQKCGQAIEEQQKASSQAISELSLLTERLAYNTKKLEEIGNIELSLQEIEDRSHSLSMSVSQINQRKGRHYYTARQKIFFTRIEQHRANLIQKRTQFQRLIEAENKILQLLEDCQREKDSYLTDIFKSFENAFKQTFKMITGGNATSRLKRNQQKTRGNKQKNSIAISVSFSPEGEPNNRWSELSGGQKSILAFCILMALQRCEPAPFYILDQIDSALDPVYLERIVQLIRQQSMKSQYFITSFKRQMLEFPENICNYYYVEMQDRVSKIQQVKQSQAQKSIENIIN